MATTTAALPKVGDAAPDFTLPSSEGKDLGPADFLGKQAVVLYFYPKDDTTGCTAEACAFRDIRGEFEARGAAILGVSPDSLRAHDKFRKKYDLNFPLLADTDHALAERYGVWQLKKFMGREYMGIVRTTFVIDKAGKIAAVFPNVKVTGHADAVLKAVEDLQ